MSFDQMSEVIEKSISKAIDDLPKFISQKVRDMAMSSLGFKESFGKIEVDHCNGRNSVLSGIVNEHATKFIENNLVKEIKKLKVTKAMKEAVNKEFQIYLDRHLRYEVEKHVANIVNSTIIKVVNDVVKNHIKEAAAKMVDSLKGTQDISNPEFGNKFHEKVYLKLLELDIAE